MIFICNESPLSQIAVNYTMGGRDNESNPEQPPQIAWNYVFADFYNATLSKRQLRGDKTKSFKTAKSLREKRASEGAIE